MLTGLKIGNFKAFGETQHIPIRPLTLIFGANSSGKSSILQALQLLRHVIAGGAADAHNLKRASTIDLGGFNEFVHAHEPDRIVDIAMELGGQDGLGMREWERMPTADAPLLVHVSIGKESTGENVVHQGRLARLLRLSLTLDDAYPGSRPKSTRQLELNDASWMDRMEENGRALREIRKTIGEDAEFDQPTLEFLNDHLRALYLDPKLGGNRFFRAAMREGLEPGLFYLGPIRFQPPRRQLLLNELDEPSFLQGKHLWELGTLNVYRSEANDVLGRLGMPYRVEVREWTSTSRTTDTLRELVLRDTKGLSVSVRDVGTGVSQVLPIVIATVLAESSLIAVEQPELHLHPAMQAELGDVFIGSALGKRKNTFLLETHSEHLILRILRRVRETSEGRLPEGKTPVRPQDLAVLYVQQGPKGAEVIELPVTPDGDFSRPWPNGFFAERFQELP